MCGAVTRVSPSGWLSHKRRHRVSPSLEHGEHGAILGAVTTKATAPSQRAPGTRQVGIGAHQGPPERRAGLSCGAQELTTPRSWRDWMPRRRGHVPGSNCGSPRHKPAVRLDCVRGIRRSRKRGGAAAGSTLLRPRRPVGSTETKPGRVLQPSAGHRLFTVSVKHRARREADNGAQAVKLIFGLVAWWR
jgi:hypothetical protein